MISLLKSSQKSSPFDVMRRIVMLTQLLIYLPTLLLRYAVVKETIQSQLIFPLSLQKKVRYVLYANHQSMLDPFIICASLPFKLFLRLLPFRFFIANMYLKNPVLAFFLKILGCFPAYAVPDKPYGLDKAKGILKSKQTVVIFPTGKRTREKVAKRGISVLAQEPSVYLIPIYLNWKGRLHCEIGIGNAFRCDDKQIDPEVLMQVVYALGKNGS